MSHTTPKPDCPNPNFCYVQGCLGHCGNKLYPTIARHNGREVILSFNREVSVEELTIFFRTIEEVDWQINLGVFPEVPQAMPSGDRREEPGRNVNYNLPDHEPCGYMPSTDPTAYTD